jgi:hypothetical protein
VGLDGLIASIKNEHPLLGPPVFADEVASWLLPTGWTFLMRKDDPGVSVAVSKGERPVAWVPMTETEALGSLRWFMKRRR